MAAVGDEMHAYDGRSMRRGFVEATCGGLPVVRWNDGTVTIVTRFIEGNFFKCEEDRPSEHRGNVLVKRVRA